MIQRKLFIILIALLISNCGSGILGFLSSRKTPKNSKDIVVPLSLALLFSGSPSRGGETSTTPPSTTEPNDPWKYPAKLRVLSTGDGSLLVSWGTWCNNTEDDDIKERTENDSCLPANAYFTVEFCDDNKSTTTNCRPVPIEQPKENSTQVLECTTKEYNEAAPDPCFKTRYSHAVISKDADHKPLIQTDTVNGIQGANAVKFIKIKAHQGEKFRYVPISGNIGYFNNTIVDTPNQDLQNPTPAPGKISFNKQQYIYGLSKIDYLKSSEMISVFLVIGTRTYDQIIQRTRIDFLLNEKKVRYISGTIQMELDNGSSQLMMKGVLSWAKVALLIAQMDQGQGSEFYNDLEAAIKAVDTGNPLDSFKTYSTSIFPTDSGKFPSYTHSVELPLRSESYPFGKKDKGYQGISAIEVPDIVKAVYNNNFLVPENTTLGSIVNLKGVVAIDDKEDRHLFSILSYMSMDSEGYDFVKDRTGMFICFNEKECVQDIGNTSSTSGSAGIYFHPLSKLDRTENSAVVGILFSVISSFVVNTVIPQIVNAAVNAVKDWAIKEVMKNIPILRDIQKITKQITQALDFIDQVRNFQIPEIKMPDIGNVNISFNPSIPTPSLEIPNIGISFQNPLEQFNFNPNIKFDILPTIRFDFQLGFNFGEWFKGDGEECDTSGVDGGEIVSFRNRCIDKRAGYKGSDEDYAKEKQNNLPDIGKFVSECKSKEPCDMDFRGRYCRYHHRLWKDFGSIFEKININSVFGEKGNCSISYPFLFGTSNNVLFSQDNSPVKFEGMNSHFKAMHSKELAELLVLNHKLQYGLKEPNLEVGLDGWFWDLATEGDELCDQDKPKPKELVNDKFEYDIVCYNGTSYNSCTDSNAFKLKYKTFASQILASSNALYSTTLARMIHIKKDTLQYLAKFCFNLKNDTALECSIEDGNSTYRDPIHNIKAGSQSINSKHIFGKAIDFEIRTKNDKPRIYYKGGSLVGNAEYYCISNCCAKPRNQCTWQEKENEKRIWGRYSNLYNPNYYKIFKSIYDTRKKAGDDFTLMLEGTTWHMSTENKEGYDPWSGSEYYCGYYNLGPYQHNVCRDFKRCVDGVSNNNVGYSTLEDCIAKDKNLLYKTNPPPLGSTAPINIAPQSNNQPLHKQIWDMFENSTQLNATSGGGGGIQIFNQQPSKPNGMTPNSTINGDPLPFESLPEAAYGAHPLVFHVEDRTNATQEDKIGFWTGDWNEWDSQNRYNSRVVEVNLGSLVTGNYYMVMWGNTPEGTAPKLHPDSPNCNANFTYNYPVVKSCCILGCDYSCVSSASITETHTGYYGSVCNVEISNDLGSTWGDLTEGYKIFSGNPRLKFSRIYSMSPYSGYNGFQNVGLGYEKALPIVIYEKQSPKHRIYTYTLFIKEANTKDEVVNQFIKIGVGDQVLIVKVEKPYNMKSQEDLFANAPVFAQKQEKDQYNLNYTFAVDDKYLYILGSK